MSPKPLAEASRDSPPLARLTPRSTAPLWRGLGGLWRGSVENSRHTTWYIYHRPPRPPVPSRAFFCMASIACRTIKPHVGAEAADSIVGTQDSRHRDVIVWREELRTSCLLGSMLLAGGADSTATRCRRGGGLCPSADGTTQHALSANALRPSRPLMTSLPRVRAESATHGGGPRG